MTNFLHNIASQTFIFALIGGLAGYFTMQFAPSKTGGELLQVIGGITAVGGSLLGWSAGWLDQSRALVKDIDYNGAEQLYRKMREAQSKLIWRWGIALSSSLIVVVSSVIVGKDTLDPNLVKTAYVVCLVFLSVSLLSVFSLFRSMLASAEIRARLEDYQLGELRKLRNAPPVQETKDESNRQVV